jgi:alkylhydroperoxidase family enzyme
MLSFAVKLARSPETITPTDHKLLQDHGFGKDEIWDIGAITAFYALSNRMAHLIEMRANDEFYLMGRQAKSKN